VRNPKPCPVLEVLEPGVVEPRIAPGADLRSDLPRYNVFKQGKFQGEVQDVTDIFHDEMVSFLLGCSFSFENGLVAGGIPVRNLEEKRNVSMYITNRPCVPAGPFSAQLVVTMRPMQPEEAVRATQITTRYHLTHGAPIHIGSPEVIGIRDLGRPDFGDPVTIKPNEMGRPDFGDPVTIKPNEIPVFWACGVTAMLAATSVPLPLVITHAPGHMFVSDMKDEQLTLF
jgi:uncharacterized protein YcsI (UPF0317 family)